MGLTRVDGVVAGPGGQPEHVKFLVDSGAQYSVLPYEVWHKLGLRSKRSQALHLADGTTIERGLHDLELAVLRVDADGVARLGDALEEHLRERVAPRWTRRGRR